ncbi:hypothetical protein Tco_0016569, partial [Tanacetum coccineum]
YSLSGSPIYPEYIPLEDDHEFLAEEQPLPPIDSPTAESPGYITESDPEEDPEGYEDDETEDGPVDYPIDGGDDGDDDDGDSSRDDVQGMWMRTRRMIGGRVGRGALLARLTLLRLRPSRLPYPLSYQTAEWERLARCTAPPAHSLSITTIIYGLYNTGIQTLKDSFTQLSLNAVNCRQYQRLPTTTYHQSLSLPSPFFVLGNPYEIGESSTARPARGQGIDYGFVSTVDAEERRQGIRDVGVTELAELHERDTQDLYALLEDAQDSRSRISQRVDMNSQRVDLLMGDRKDYSLETVWMVEEEAYASREAWGRSIGLSQATHQELQTHHDHVYAHETYLQAHQTQLQLQSTLIQTQHQMVGLSEVIRVMRRELMCDMQAELLALREPQRRARQPGPEARIPDHQEASGDADSHI